MSKDNEELCIVLTSSAGLMYVGYVDPYGKLPLSVLSARCVIRWGTSGHIAELINGPTDKTKLGDEADIVLRQEPILIQPVNGEWYE